MTQVSAYPYTRSKARAPLSMTTPHSPSSVAGRLEERRRSLGQLAKDVVVSVKRRLSLSFTGLEPTRAPLTLCSEGQTRMLSEREAADLRLLSAGELARVALRLGVKPKVKRANTSARHKAAVLQDALQFFGKFVIPRQLMLLMSFDDFLSKAWGRVPLAAATGHLRTNAASFQQLQVMGIASDMGLKKLDFLLEENAKALVFQAQENVLRTEHQIRPSSSTMNLLEWSERTLDARESDAWVIGEVPQSFPLKI